MNPVPDKSRPIGVFDSGLGGLSVLRELVTALPAEDFIYVADSAHCPYGVKTAEAIIERAVTLTDFLLGQGVKLIVVACNTATVAAVGFLRARYPIDFVGMEPAIKPAAAATHSGVVGVLSTGVTASGERLQRLIRDHAQGTQVLTQPCPGLVEQVEAGDLEGESTRVLLQRYIAPLLVAGADTLVLGCTHYAFLKPQITQIVGCDIALIDTGAAVARRCAAVLAQNDLLAAQAGQGALHWYSSGEPANMERIGARLWGRALQVAAIPTAAPASIQGAL